MGLSMPDKGIEMETDDCLIRRIPAKYRSFVVLFGAILVQFSLGILYTFGNTLPYFHSYIRWKVNPDQSVTSFLYVQALICACPFSQIFGGFLTKKIGSRKSAIVGIFFYFMGIITSSYTIKHSFVMFVFTYGALCGFGIGIAYNSILILLHKWFPGHIGFATGFALAGLASNSFVLSGIQTYFVNPDGYTAKNDGTFTEIDLLQRIPKLFILMAFSLLTLQIVGVIFLAEPKRKVESTKHTKGNIINSFRSLTFVNLFITFFFTSLWSQTLSGLYKAYGQLFMHDDHFLSIISSVSSLFNLFGRIFWGKFCDKTCYQVSMVIICAIGSVMMWTIGVVRLIEDRYLFMIWVCIMFWCIGGSYTALPYAINKCFGTENFGVLFGLIQNAVVLAGISAALISQVILHFMSYEFLFLIISSLLMISFTLASTIQLTKYGKLKIDNI